jgi:hypothetical protein
MFPPLEQFFPMGNCACSWNIYNSSALGLHPNLPTIFSYASNQFLFWSFIVLMSLSLLLLLACIFNYIRKKRNGKKLVSPIFVWALGMSINFLPLIASFIFDGKLKPLLLLTSVIGGLMIVIWGIKLKNYAGKKRLFWFLTFLYWVWILLAIINGLFMNCMGANC